MNKNKKKAKTLLHLPGSIQKRSTDRDRGNSSRGGLAPIEQKKVKIVLKDDPYSNLKMNKIRTLQPLKVRPSPSARVSVMRPTPTLGIVSLMTTKAPTTIKTRSKFSHPKSVPPSEKNRIR